MNTQPSPSRTKTPRPDWPIVTALILISIIPMLGGIARLVALGGQADTPENARFLSAPMPIVIHVFTSVVFCILGAFQFAPRFRQRHPQWHRMAGRWLMVAGLASGLSGIWMTVAYTIPTALQGPLLYIVRLLVGAGMTVSIVLAWNTIRRRNVAGHRAWIMRAYALGQGAGTQPIVILPYMALFGQPDQLTRDVLMTAAWVINLLIVEWILRRPTVGQRERPARPPAMT